MISFELQYRAKTSDLLAKQFRQAQSIQFDSLNLSKVIPSHSFAFAQACKVRADRNLYTPKYRQLRNT